jgi:phosphoribosylanthranilate isomerase
MLKPYVGITGITKSAQTIAIDQMLEELDWPDSHEVMYGVLVSGWTLQGKEPTDVRQYPLSGEVSGLESRHPRALNLIHYNDARRPFALDLQLAGIKVLAPDFDGVQLNFTWPNPIELRRVAKSPALIVLQMGAKALREAGRDNVGQWIRSYGGSVDYVLVDLSGGTGKSLNVADSQALLEIMTAASDTYRLNLAFGVAGGLNAEQVSKLAPLLQRFPGLSWDAQAGLRNAAGELDLGRVRGYLAASLKLIRSATT